MWGTHPPAGPSALPQRRHASLRTLPVAWGTIVAGDGLAQFCPWPVESGSLPVAGVGRATRPRSTTRRPRWGGDLCHPLLRRVIGHPVQQEIPLGPDCFHRNRGWQGWHMMMTPRVLSRTLRGRTSCWKPSWVRRRRGSSGDCHRPRRSWGAPQRGAQDRETDVAIARRLGIGRRTLARWKQRPEFRAALAALQAQQAEAPRALEAEDAGR